MPQDHFAFPQRTPTANMGTISMGIAAPERSYQPSSNWKNVPADSIGELAYYEAAAATMSYQPQRTMERMSDAKGIQPEKEGGCFSCLG